jgi:UTP--glucose-1-phosphate uridylyltransferase
MAHKVRKIVIPAGGLGTRFLPVTKAVPKELLPIGTKPTLQMIVEEAVASGIEEVILITSRQKPQLLDFFTVGTAYDRKLAELGKTSMLEGLNKLLARTKVTSVYQEEPKGLGHAILCTRDAVGDEPFIIALPDVLIESATPCCRQLADAYAHVGCSLSATEHTPRAQIHLYGVYDIARTQGRMHWARGVVEKPKADEAPSDFSVVGRYLFTPEVFEILATLPPGRGGEIQLADAMNELARREKMIAFEYDGQQFDTGDPLGFLKANIFYGWQLAPTELATFTQELARRHR